jgi:hypothetical protein
MKFDAKSRKEIIVWEEVCRKNTENTAWSQQLVTTALGDYVGEA